MKAAFHLTALSRSKRGSRRIGPYQIPFTAGRMNVRVRGNWLDMLPIILVLLLALILFGAGFALKALWWIAVIVLVVWLVGFFVRPAGHGGKRGRWYRW